VDLIKQTAETQSRFPQLSPATQLFREFDIMRAIARFCFESSFAGDRGRSQRRVIDNIDSSRQQHSQSASASSIIIHDRCERDGAPSSR